MAPAPAPPPTQRRSALLPLIAIVVFTLLSCALFGVLVALPSYNKFIKRSRQSECFSSARGPFEDRSRAQEVRPPDATGILADTY